MKRASHRSCADHRRSRIQPEQHLRRRGDFQAIQEYGFSRAHPLLVLRVAPNFLLYPRFAFAVGRRVAKKAVVRNRVRRRIREVVRQTPVQQGWDLLFIARSRAAEASFAALREAVLNVERRAGVLESSSSTTVPEAEMRCDE